MDNSLPQNLSAEVKPVELILPAQPRKNPLKLIGWLILATVMLTGAVMVGIQVGKSQSTVVVSPTPPAAPENKVAVQPSIEPAIEPTVEVMPTQDPKADWTTYVNPTHNFSFSYPSTWTLNNKGEAEKLNASVRLIKDKNVIQVYAAMDGIGGSGNDYDGTPITVGGLNLFKYHSVNTFAKTQQVGLTDELKNSLGLFKVGQKTFAIFLTMPNNETDKTKNSELEKEFDQILTTVKFN